MPNLPPHFPEDAWGRSQFASETKSEDDLKILCADKSIAVRRACASNLHTPECGLIELSKNKDWIVRFKVAKNPNSPSKALFNIIENSDSVIVKIAKQHPNIQHLLAFF
jgi:hypothetical protein